MGCPGFLYFSFGGSRHRKNDKSAINVNNACEAISTLKRVISETGLQKNCMCAVAFWAGPRPGPGPKCNGPHAFFSRPVSERIPFRAAMAFPRVLGQRKNAMGAINVNNMNIDGTHTIFRCQGHQNEEWSNQGFNTNTC